jgi:acylphosphatase
MICRWLISGIVQGVGFRYFVLNRARVLGITGWVRNLPDGRVEVVGKGAREVLQVLESALRGGPAHASVSDVEKTEISDDADRFMSFEIR